MLLQVHDELVFEVPEGREAALIKIVTDTMEHAHEPAVSLTVPIDVEANSAKNWNDAH